MFGWWKGCCCIVLVVFIYAYERFVTCMVLWSFEYRPCYFSFISYNNFLRISHYFLGNNELLPHHAFLYVTNLRHIILNLLIMIKISKVYIHTQNSKPVIWIFNRFGYFTRPARWPRLLLYCPIRPGGDQIKQCPRCCCTSTRPRCIKVNL